MFFKEKNQDVYIIFYKNIERSTIGIYRAGIYIAINDSWISYFRDELNYEK